MSFTPGPWDFSWEIQPNGCPTVGHKGLMVCMVAHSAKDTEQKETALANASLIAAAPELLEALETIAGLYDHEASSGENSMKLYDARSIALEVIAKARGEVV